jgi:hypothetical protein
VDRVIVVFLALGVLALGLLGAAPVGLWIEGGAPLEFRIRYLGFRWNLRPLVRNKPGSPGEGKWRDKLEALTRLAPLLRRPLGFERFRLRLGFSTGDAAETALCFGGLCLFLNALPLSRVKGERTLLPCFSSRPQVSLDCDIRLTLPAAVFLLRWGSLTAKKKGRPGRRGGRHV